MKKTATLISLLALALSPWAWGQYDIIWDGGPLGTGTSWNVSANWLPDTIPTIADEATFTNTGLVANKIISLDAAQGVATLTISTATAFTIGSASDRTAGNTLTLTDLVRNDVAGTEGVQTIATDVVLNGSSTWAVDGANYLAVTGSISGAAPLVKTGAGELRFGAANSYSGDTTVQTGTLRVTAGGAIQGNLIVGVGASAALFTTSTTSDAIANAKNVTVNGNGTVSFGVSSENLNNLTLNGGTFNTNYSYINGSITMTGGTLGGSGAFYGTHRDITVNASSSTAVIAVANNVYGSLDSTFTVNDGAAIIDLKNTGALASSGTNRKMTKAGAGVMVLSAGSSMATGTFAVTAGTLLVTNTAGSASGQALVTVGGGATLGGTGLLGGVSGYTRANVTLAGSSTASLATLAPGTLNETDSSHIIGTLTVGGAAQSNTATVGNFSQLKLVLGNAGTGDKLAVLGDLNLASAGGSDQLTIQSPTDTMAGIYSLAIFSGTLTGRFDVATVNGNTQFPLGYELQYRNSSSQVVSGTDNITTGSIVLAVDNGAWTTVPLGGGGYVTGLVASSAGDIYCRTDVGGAFRWDAASGGWISLSDKIVPYGTTGAEGLMNVDGIGLDPNNANQIYIGAGSSGTGLRGIFSSTDRGATWIQINSTIRMGGNGSYRTCGERLAVDPNNSNLLWYGSILDGLQKGVKSGGTWSWSQIPSTSVPFGAANAGVTFVACDPNGGSTLVYAGVYSGTGTACGVYKSADGGANWSKVGGIALNVPARGQVAPNGTLYVTHTGLVAKMARGGSFIVVTPTSDAGLNYKGLAVAPSDASGNTVYVAESANTQYARIWRTTDGGATWARQYTNFNNANYSRMEPDGTPCLTGYWFGNVAALLVSPGNANELWASDFFGVARTQNAQQIGTASGAFWYLLQKGQEETVVLDLKSLPSGARLMSGVADVGGFRYLNVANRPYGSSGNTLGGVTGGNNTSLDFSEGTPAVCARAWVNSGAWGGSAAVSVDGGVTWLKAGQPGVVRTVTNAPTAGWESWDISTYLAKQKAKGVNTVTLVVGSGNTPNYTTGALYFDSKEAADTALRPSLLVNGSTTLVTIADTYVAGASPTMNYGTSTALLASYAWGTTSYTRFFYVKFDLSGVGSITSAVLQLHRQASANTYQYPVGVYACTNTSWVEGNGGSDNVPAGEMTWNNYSKALSNAGGPPQEGPDYYDGGTHLWGGRIAVSATDPTLLVWMPIGAAPRYSNDGGITWTASTGAPASQITGIYTNGSSIATSGLPLAADRGNGYFYLGSFGGAGHVIYRSTNNGATWAVTSTVSNGNSYNMRTPQLVAAPASGDVWLCDDGSYNGNGGGLWRSTNAAVNWSAIAGVGKVTAVSFGKGQAGGYTVFIAGSIGGVKGIYRSDNYGTNWTKLANPTVELLTALAGDRQNYGRVFIGTGGRGTFVGF